MNPRGFYHTNLLADKKTATNDCPEYFPYSKDDNILVVGDAKNKVSYSISKMAGGYDKKKMIGVSLICSEKIKPDDPMITYLKGHRYKVQDATVLKGMLKKPVVNERVEGKKVKEAQRDLERENRDVIDCKDDDFVELYKFKFSKILFVKVTPPISASVVDPTTTTAVETVDPTTTTLDPE